MLRTYVLSRERFFFFLAEKLDSFARPKIQQYVTYAESCLYVGYVQVHTMHANTNFVLWVRNVTRISKKIKMR